MDNSKYICQKIEHNIIDYKYIIIIGGMLIYGLICFSIKVNAD